jgi:hypothetical protein
MGVLIAALRAEEHCLANPGMTAAAQESSRYFWQVEQ